MFPLRSVQPLNEFLPTGAIRTVFQPIARGDRVRQTIYAFECLSRGPAGSQLEGAQALFERTRLLGMESDIDRACLHRALDTARHFLITHPLFINVHAATLRHDPEFVAFVSESAVAMGIPSDRLVIEVIEHARDVEGAVLREALLALRARGVQVALDDFGANRADLQLLRDWEPDWVKLDGNLLRWARRSSAARQIIECAVSDSVRRGTVVIAEGLENSADLDLAAALGIEHLQGFSISPPLRADEASRLTVASPLTVLVQQ